MSDQIRPVTADGIEEFDNALPHWWVWLFKFTVLFAVVYMAWLHIYGGESIQHEYEREVAALEKGSHQSDHEANENHAGNEPHEAGELLAVVSDPNAKAAGKAVYTINCLPCHGVAGEGTVGPNLTDRFWIHGGKPEQIEKAISEGVLEKGMPAWKPILGETKVRQLVAYVISLQGSNPPNPKAAQGNPEP